MTKEQREALIDVLIEHWLKLLSYSDTDAADQIREWLRYGRTGYTELTDEELIDTAGDWGWDELGANEEDFK